MLPTELGALSLSLAAEFDLAADFIELSGPLAAVQDFPASLVGLLKEIGVEAINEELKRFGWRKLQLPFKELA
jgi:hypothetical protein